MEQSKNKHLKQNLIRFIGLIIFILILYYLDVRYIVDQLKRINLHYLFLAVLILILFHFCKALRWKYILKIQHIHYSLIHSYLIYLSGLFIGILTPGRVGDFVKIYYLKKYHPDISLFVQTSPAFCCPSLITEAMARKIEAKTGIPIVSITYDGTAGDKNHVIVPYLKTSRHHSHESHRSMGFD